MNNDQPKGTYTGIDVLARKPDATVLVVNDVMRADAEAFFPEMAVVGVTGIPKPDMLAGRKVIIWPSVESEQTALPDSLCGVAAKVGIIAGDRNPLQFEGNDVAVRHYARTSLRPYTPRAAPEATHAKVNGSDAPVSRSAQPSVDAALEAAKEDAGALLEPLILEHLRQLRALRPAEYQRIRAAAKETATNVSELDRLTGPKASVTPITEARQRQQAKPQPDPDHDYTPLAEDSLAMGFSAAHPELRYVAAWKRWLHWQDGWQEDSTLYVFDLARAHCRDMANEHALRAAASAIVKAKSAGTRAAVESLARADRRHACEPSQWDADGYALNTPGGLVDLRTGDVRAVRLDDYCLKRTQATPGGACPLWLDFLRYGTNGDDALIAFLQRWYGANMTGDTREQKFVFVHGRGGAGKGTMLNLVTRILGTYARNMAMETLTESHNERHPEELARLAGIRMCTASETQQGRRWNEARIKMLTGQDTVTARFMAQNSFEYVPQLKLTIMGNHPPGLRSVDPSMKRRLLIVPFDHLPQKVDGHLPDKLWAERDGILQWMLEGCMAWQREGLAIPESVRKASEAYFSNQDVVGQWIAESCVTGNECSAKVRALYQSYVTFVEPGGYQPLRQRELMDELQSRGYRRGGYESAPLMLGIMPKPKDDHQSWQPD